jgi:hypothetical protein
VGRMFSTPGKVGPHFWSIRAAYLIELGERGQIYSPQPATGASPKRNHVKEDGRRVTRLESITPKSRTTSVNTSRTESRNTSSDLRPIQL